MRQMIIGGFFGLIVVANLACGKQDAVPVQKASAVTASNVQLPPPGTIPPFDGDIGKVVIETDRRTYVGAVAEVLKTQLEKSGATWGPMAYEASNFLCEEGEVLLVKTRVSDFPYDSQFPKEMQISITGCTVDPKATPSALDAYNMLGESHLYKKMGYDIQGLKANIVFKVKHTNFEIYTDAIVLNL